MKDVINGTLAKERLNTLKSIVEKIIMNLEKNQVSLEVLVENQKDGF